MPRFLLLAPVLALALGLPVHASHPGSTKVTASTTATVPLSAPISSTKGARLVAHSVLVGAVTVPKKIAAKPAVKSAPNPAPVVVAAKPVPAAPLIPTRLARLTAYWTQEDPWTAKHESSTGIRLHEGFCAVDPKLIPYGSVIQIPGMGSYVAVDTGSAVISREAAVGSGHTVAERAALVVDLFFENRKDAEGFAAHGPAYVSVSWTPRSLAYADSGTNNRALPAIPTMPAGTVYVLAQAPSMADMRMPLAFRAPQL